MSRRPNFQGGRRGGGGGSSSSAPGRGGGGRGGGGGGGGRGRGEQRWWDPVWRAERLRQKAVEMEVLDENEWWNKMEKMKNGGDQEMIVKRNYSRDDQQTLSDMAYQLSLYFHAYNKGKTLVVSKVPLPNYRADLDERHGSTQKEASNCVKELQSFRQKLPAFKVKGEFLKAVSENQVLVISGETGCGKTTQLPQYVLDEEIASLRGADCSIICTQPRRISAISVAARISSERGENLGETVGYQIRLEAKRSAQTRTPILHHWCFTPAVGSRSRFDWYLRLILMSATINANLFSKYFGNAPTIHIPGLTFPVTELFLEDILEKSRYKIQSEAGNFQGNSRRRRRREQDSKKDSLTELFEDVDIDSKYKNYSASTRLSLEAWSGSPLDLGLVESAIEFICLHEGDGAILVFLTGWDEISKLLDRIKGNKLLGDQSKFLVLPLHGSMPTINQREIFDRPPPNKRKIVLATNIAESSITIDDVVYVVDCGKAKETSYDALNKLACLLPSWISKASAHQRRGRAGRVQPGVCYRLYPKIIHDAMLQYQLPEILRTPLQELCLHIKSLQLGAVGSFLAKALQPPDPLSVQNAIELLKTIGALDDNEELTTWSPSLYSAPGPKYWKDASDGAYNQYSHDLEMVSAILCAGLYPNVVQCKRRGKRTAFYTKEVGKVDIHPASVNAGVHLFPLPYMVYSEKVKTSGIYIRDSTNISDYALLLFGGSLIPSNQGEGIDMLGDYTQALSFSIDRFDPGANNIIYEEPLHLWDSSTRTLTDFTTNFSFTIDTLNADTYGHGIVFFLSSVGNSIPTNSPGGFLGLFNTTTSDAASRNQLVMAEFDTFVNEEWDPPVQHVGINNNSIRSAVYAKWDPGSYSGKTAKVGISYNATAKNLSVLWTYDENLVFTGNNSLSYVIDLMELLPEWVSIGFSASTGQYLERNQINSWAFSSNLRTKVANNKKGELKRRRILPIALIALACVCVLALLCGVSLFVKNKCCPPIPVPVDTDIGRKALPRKFGYQELAEATNNFANDRKLGEGGSGLVFKGFLRELGRLVAVKKN
ncbi:hypothetical protein GH714_035758 [Hevea brasiliensis]|uniref:RNA helicase n=1 Tax=Hevea brasiliensis TaxID=3981 RepID=A0A6A6N8Q2_HEVBR|nr:hypothetical protein GH714_035758 [Hevea brasiliensis]